MKNKIFFYLFFILIIFPHISLAAVNLPWSTTYNCNEWKQTDGNPNCDGLDHYGDWTTSDGKEEQITSAANYPGGAGVRGQRHWLGDNAIGGTAVNNSGGTSIAFALPQPELWIRWYMRFQNGFQWALLSEYKIFYIDVLSSTGTRVIVGYRSWDSLGIVANGYSHDSPSGNGWNTIMANGGTDANGNKTSDGLWHLYEIHLKMDTNGSNGIVEWWVDGVSRLNHANVNYGTQPGWSSMVIGSNSIHPANGSTAFYVDYDDIVISATGPIGGNPTLPPSGGNTSPSDNGNTGGDASASGGSGCGFVKEDNGKGQKAKGEGLSIAMLFLLPILFIIVYLLYKRRKTTCATV